MICGCIPFDKRPQVAVEDSWGCEETRLRQRNEHLARLIGYNRDWSQTQDSLSRVFKKITWSKVNYLYIFKYLQPSACVWITRNNNTQTLMLVPESMTSIYEHLPIMRASNSYFLCHNTHNLFLNKQSFKWCICIWHSILGLQQWSYQWRRLAAAALCWIPADEETSSASHTCAGDTERLRRQREMSEKRTVTAEHHWN